VEKALKNGADIMVNIDADGQFSSGGYSLKWYRRFITKKADMVVASRFGKNKEDAPQNMPWVKKNI